MSNSFDLAVARSLRLRETLGVVPHPQGMPEGCKGTACPAFALCQERRVQAGAAAPATACR